MNNYLTPDIKCDLISVRYGYRYNHTNSKLKLSDEEIALPRFLSISIAIQEVLNLAWAFLLKSKVGKAEAVGECWQPLFLLQLLSGKNHIPAPANLKNLYNSFYEKLQCGVSPSLSAYQRGCLDEINLGTTCPPRLTNKAEGSSHPRSTRTSYTNTNTNSSLHTTRKEKEFNPVLPTR